MLPEIIRTREALEDCAALMMRAATAVARAEGAVRTEIQCNQVAAYGGAAEARKIRDAGFAAADKLASDAAAHFGQAMASFREAGADKLAKAAQDIADQADALIAEAKTGGPKRGDNFRSLGVIEGGKQPHHNGPGDAA